MSREAGFQKRTSQEGNPDKFFQDTCQEFHKAIQSLGESIDQYYSMGGLLIKLQFAGPALVSRLSSAFAHLKTNPDRDPDLTILLWDSESTGAQSPVPPSINDYQEYGLIRGYNNSTVKTVYQYALESIDLEKDLAFYWISDAQNTPIYHTITPLRSILHWWFLKHNRYIIHAASVGYPEGGLLITGSSGAGKSTTALSCLNSDLFYLSDENCLISIDQEPFVYSLYCSGTLESEDVNKIPALKSSLRNASKLATEKAVYILSEKYKSRLTNGFPIKAVLVPNISGKQSSSIQECSTAYALKALAPGSLFQLPGASEKSFHAMAELLRQVPTFSLELGTDLSGVPQVIEKFLKGIG